MVLACLPVYRQWRRVTAWSVAGAPHHHLCLALGLEREPFPRAVLRVKGAAAPALALHQALPALLPLASVPCQSFRLQPFWQLTPGTGSS